MHTSGHHPLFDRLRDVLAGGGSGQLTAAGPIGRRDRFLTLLRIYDLHLAPLHETGPAARLAADPAVAALKARLETDWLAELEAAERQPHQHGQPGGTADPVAAMRASAARERIPPAYRWLARTANWRQLVRFLAVEGGPDGGFDDLVAACQIGLAGPAKLELATNYWDEMGNGAAADVHTTLYERMVAAIGMPTVPRAELPVEALERAALGGLLATNHWLQPEMLGALGLTELQAGPRCRLVLAAFDRLGAPADAFPFYRVHADVDPRHGRDWLDNAVAPVCADHPDWAPRVLRGAHWRARTNDALFARLHAEATRPARTGGGRSPETDPRPKMSQWAV